MIVRQIPLNDAAIKAMQPAVERDGHDWLQIIEWLNSGCAAVWSIGDVGYVLTLANGDDEIEVLLGGGMDARRCAGPWETAVLNHPAHRGKTLRLEGRKGWQKIFKTWELRADGALYRRVGE